MSCAGDATLETTGSPLETTENGSVISNCTYLALSNVQHIYQALTLIPAP